MAEAPVAGEECRCSGKRYANMDFDDAICVAYARRGDPDYWLSEEKTDQRQARELCKLCPLQVECALLRDEVKPVCGTWAGQTFGGFSEEARKKTEEYRKRKRAAASK